MNTNHNDPQGSDSIGDNGQLDLLKLHSQTSEAQQEGPQSTLLRDLLIAIVFLFFLALLTSWLLNKPIVSFTPTPHGPSTERVESTDNARTQTTTSSESELMRDSESQSELSTPIEAVEVNNGVASNKVSEADKNTEIVKNLGFSPADTLDKAVAKSAYCLDSENAQTSKVSVAQACKRISNRLASVSLADCEVAQLRATSCLSVNGFPILVREFPPLETREPQGKILVIGGTHGDELTSVSITFEWIRKLNKHHSGLFHWHMVPMMNPDGVLNRAAQRTNSHGVDLNRNLPSDDWHENALRYWRNKHGSNPRRYPGENPASEPESQWLIDEINAFKPDAIISIHAPYGVVDFDAPLLNTAPKSLGKLRLNLLGTYPGSLGNYAGINRAIPVITLELPHAWEMPSDRESTKIWEDIVSWLKRNIGK